jgi:hypothetical protein
MIQQRRGEGGNKQINKIKNEIKINKQTKNVKSDKHTIL